jgi:mannose-6-phosphate isomerase-like protein (cupin superfamily)
MEKVRIHPVEDVAWRRVTDDTSEELELSEEELKSSYAVHEPGDGETLQLFEVDFEPGCRVQVHAHDEDEIIYVLKGELHFGRQVLRPGSSLFIRGKAFYSFSAGPEGLRFLNFRPKADRAYHKRGELAAND